MKKWTFGLTGLLLSWPFAIFAGLDPSTLDPEATGTRSKVLVLGSVHLNQMPKSVDPDSLDRLLERLAEFRPDIITIEALSGEECDIAARHPSKYGADYCTSPDRARTTTGMDIPTAMAEVDKMLKTWPEDPDPARRRRLAALLLAASDRASAYVQWLQLPRSERVAGNGLDQALVEMLQETESRNSENYQVAARLAARLRMARVHAVDNHTGDRIDVPDRQAFTNQIESAWNAGRAELDRQIEREQLLSQAPDLLPLYRMINGHEYLKVLADANIRPLLRAKSQEGYSQIWIAGWEIRNLRMAANIRETFRERPNARVLSIVGVSHKPWLDHWLGQLQGVEIVDVASVLE